MAKLELRKEIQADGEMTFFLYYDNVYVRDSVVVAGNDEESDKYNDALERAMKLYNLFKETGGLTVTKILCTDDIT